LQVESQAEKKRRRRERDERDKDVWLVAGLSGLECSSDSALAVVEPSEAASPVDNGQESPTNKERKRSSFRQRMTSPDIRIGSKKSRRSDGVSKTVQTDEVAVKPSDNERMLNASTKVMDDTFVPLVHTNNNNKSVRGAPVSTINTHYEVR